MRIWPFTASNVTPVPKPKSATPPVTPSLQEQPKTIDGTRAEREARYPLRSGKKATGRSVEWDF